jgi:hypothetical protein
MKLKVLAASARASKPAWAMPTGSSHSTHNHSRFKPKSSTVAVATTLAMRTPRAEKRSVNIVTAKSSRRRVMAEAPMKVRNTTE